MRQALAVGTWVSAELVLKNAIVEGGQAGVAASADRVYGVSDNSAGRKIQAGLAHEHSDTLRDTHRSTDTLALKLFEKVFFFLYGWELLTLTENSFRHAA